MEGFEGLKVWVCDRCGRLYPTEGEKAVERLNAVIEARGERVRSMGGPDQHLRDYAMAVICPFCLHENDMLARKG